MKESDKMSEESKQEATELYNKYRPIEIDYNMPEAEKKQHMVDWWHQALSLFVKQHFSMQDFNDMIKQGRLSIRCGILDLLQACRDEKIPLFVISGGQKTVIDLVFFHIFRAMDNNFDTNTDLESKHLHEHTIAEVFNKYQT